MKRTTVILLLILYSENVETRSIISDKDVVHTALGTIRGKEETWSGKKYTAYLGVPYGRPPVGTRRFAPPEMVERWAGELEARNFGKTCYYTKDDFFPHFPGASMWNPPPGQDQMEDCLNMNIWVPRHHDGTVLVWIYGGGFFSGSPSLDLYDGRVLAVEHNAIVININYRLGPFGFLYLGEDTEMTGNMGLMDQQLALKWIHQNIYAFGGDAKRVTLFGESAGAASATAHLIAPDSHNYFQRLIAKSGAIISSWATRRKEAMRNSSMELVRNVSCWRPDTKDIITCLRQTSTKAIQEAADEINNNLAYAIPMTFAFVPVEEDPLFFKGNVFEKIRDRDFKKDVSALVGTVKDEGTYWLPYYMSDDKFGFKFNHTISSEDPNNLALINREQYRKSLEAFIPYFHSSPLVKNALMSAYLEGSDSDNQRARYRDGVARFLGDYFFTCGLVEFADILSDSVHGNVFMYYFTMRSSMNPWPTWMGVMHGYEIEYAFGLPLRSPQQYKKEKLDVEQKFTRKIMQLWSSFANTGSPASYWPRYNRVDRKSLELNEAIVNGGYTITIDVHGTNCRLIEEGRTAAGEIRDCKLHRLSGVSSANVFHHSLFIQIALISLLKLLANLFS